MVNLVLSESRERRGLLRSIGPAIIVASVVLGPGSILASSRVGAGFGYDLVWLVVTLAVLLVGMTALAARIGISFDGTPGEEIARRGGRPLAAFVGIVVFLIIACFQFSNNVAIIAALRPHVGSGSAWPAVTLVAINLGIVAALFGLRDIYRMVEWLMKALMGLMLVGFLVNLFFARPSFGSTLSGLIPSFPKGMGAAFFMSGSGADVEHLLPVFALVGTTFSVAGAFYQAYLVRERGWKQGDLRRGLIDSVVGISVLGILSLTIMVTAAAKLRGETLEDFADVARQLEPLFGPWASVLFSCGLLAGAFSSFLVNVMIGGTVLSDGLGLGGRMDQRWPKLLTVLAAAIGMCVAMLVESTGWNPVRVILFAQAMTVLGNPVLAGVMLWLSGAARTPRWIQILALLGFLLASTLAIRTGYKLYLTLS